MSKHHLERKDVSRRAVARFPFGGSAAGDVSQLRDEFHRMFSDFTMPHFVTALGWAPAIDVSESTHGLTLTAELPGVEKHDLHVTLREGMLTIKGEKRDETAESTRYHLSE